MIFELYQKLKIKAQLEKEIQTYPKGNLCLCNTGYSQHYVLSYRCPQTKKRTAKCIRKAALQDTLRLVEERNHKRTQLKELKKQIIEIEKSIIKQNKKQNKKNQPCL